MFSLYRLDCDISGISAARQMILHLKRKDLHFIFTEKSDRTIVHSELQPHKRLYFTRVGNLIVATIYLQLIQNRYMFRSFTVLHCSHQHCVQPVASDVKVVGYL